MKIAKKILIGLGVLFLLCQFYRSPRNQSPSPVTRGIANQYPVPPEIDAMLRASCYDCHSDNTVYPWYNNFQPVSYWLNDHIESGKRHLNFDQFMELSPRRQYQRIGDIAEQVRDDEMPITSYTLIHRYAILSDAQKSQLIRWSDAMRDTMKARYPVDSLASLKRR